MTDDLILAADLSLRGAIWATDGVDYEVLVPNEWFAFVGVQADAYFPDGITLRASRSLATGEWDYSCRGLGPQGTGRIEISPQDIPPERLRALLEVLNYYPEDRP